MLFFNNLEPLKFKIFINNIFKYLINIQME